VKESIVMPRTTNTLRTGQLRAMSDETATPTTIGRTAAEDKLWAALYARPDATAAELAMAAGIGKSTAGKFLATWAKDGSVTRTPGAASGRRRAADHWKITDADDYADTLDVDATAHTIVESAPHEVADTSDVGAHQPNEPHTEAARDEPNETVTSAVEDKPVPTDLAAARSTTDGAQAPANGGTAVPQFREAGGPTDPPVKAARLRKGALRGIVEDFLRDHPAEEFTPHAIGAALHKSAGAVFNALEKLIAEEWAVRTTNAPKRYRYHERDTDATEAAQPVG
jgi:hypothetical protein